MKKAAILIAACLAGNTLLAQKCLQLNVASQAERVQQSSPGVTSFAACTTRKNDHGQTEIVDYGSAEKSLNDYVQNTNMQFQQALMGGGSNMQAMAAQMQGMSDAEKQAYAQQMVAQMRANAMQPNMNVPDNPQNAQLAMQAYTIATTQMTPLVNELAAKGRDLQAKEKSEVDAIRQPDISKCPSADKVGSPSCDCANSKWKDYWQQVMSIHDSYAAQKSQVETDYLGKLKTLAAQIDNIVMKLKYGDALNNPQYKRMLASAQSSAFGSLLAVPESLVEDGRHSGAQTYANFQNANNNLYYLGCAK